MSDLTPLGPEADPGYMRSMADRRGLLGHLRMTAMVGFGIPPLLFCLIAPYAVPPFTEWDPMSLLYPGLGIPAVALAAALPRVKPLTPGPSPEHTARASAVRFQQSTIFKLALCEVPVLLGLASSFIHASGVIPLIAGLALTALGYFTLALPTRAAVERFRARLEAEGQQSYLWTGLLAVYTGGR